MAIKASSSSRLTVVFPSSLTTPIQTPIQTSHSTHQLLVSQTPTATMVSTKNIVIGLASVVGMIQMAPAPPAVVAAVVGGVAGGAVGGAATLCSRYCPGPKVRQYAGRIVQRGLPAGVSQESVDECTQQINDQKEKGVTVQISSNSEDSKYSL